MEHSLILSHLDVKVEQIYQNPFHSLIREYMISHDSSNNEEMNTAIIFEVIFTFCRFYKEKKIKLKKNSDDHINASLFYV